MAKVSLLDEEKIISSLKSGQQPIILTNDGWLSFPMLHHIPHLSQLHRVLHLSSVNSVNIKQQSNRTHQYISGILTIISMLYACMIFLENFGIDGFIDSSVFLADADDIAWKISLYFCWAPGLFGIFLTLFDKSDEITISFETNENSEATWEISKPSKGDSLTRFIWGTIFIFLFICIFIITIGGVAIALQPPFLITGFMLFVYTRKSEIFRDVKLPFNLFTGESIDYDLFDLDERADSISDFYLHLTRFLGIEDSEGLQIIPELSETMPPEFNKLKKRVESHDSILSQIVIHYDHIFLSPTPWLSCAAVRTSTEKLLSFRVKKILPKAPKNKNLLDFRNLLNKNDTALTDNILRDIDQIRILGNTAVHNMEASTSDYMSILEKFVNVVDWHISNPPISIINDED